MIVGALALVGLGAWTTTAQAQLFGGPRYTVRYTRDGDVIVRGRGIAPVMVDPYVTTVASYPTTYVTSPVVATSYVTSAPAPMMTTTRVYAPTSAVVVSQPIPTVSYVPTVSYIPTTVMAPGYVTTTRVVASPYVARSYVPVFPTTAIAYPWP
jgi:hypothetical protein